MTIKTGLMALGLLIFGGLIGTAITSVFTPTVEIPVEIPVETVKTIEVEKPVITEKVKVVEVPQTVPQVTAPNLDLPTDGYPPILRWVDPKNLNIIYMVPNGYNATAIPMHSSVPPEWFNYILSNYASAHPDGVSEEFIDWMPRDWMKVILPGELKYRIIENTDTLIRPDNHVLVP